MSKKTREHILNTSSNLLGFCLFVITSFHITNFSEWSIIDELTTFIALLLIASALLSFYSIRSNKEMTGNKLETIAEYLFALALIGILIVVVMLVFNYVQ